VPWQTSLAAFAFVRLLTVLPITPGGLGITEFGLIATLAAGADPGQRAGDRRRAVVPGRHLPAPIPLGAIACLTWRYAGPACRMPRNRAEMTKVRRTDASPFRRQPARGSVKLDVRPALRRTAWPGTRRSGPRQHII
jgi:hypothetical protein